MLIEALTRWDRETLLLVNNGMANSLFDRVMPLITDLGLGHVQVLAILISAAVVAILKGDRRRFGLWRSVLRRKGWIAPLFFAWAISGLASTAIKNSVVRDRPVWFYKHEHEAGRNLNIHVRTLPGRGFIRVRGIPSGHTSTSVALAMAFMLISIRRRWSRKWAIASWAIALLISFSRVYLGDHWPLDVAAGVLLGVLSGFLGVRAGLRAVRDDGHRQALQSNDQAEPMLPAAGCG